MPNRNDITHLALRTLEDARAHACHGPIDRTWGHRLALAWLAHIEAGKDWHYREFWQQLANPTTTSAAGCVGYPRITHLTGLLDYWYSELGIMPPTAVQRGDWSRAAQPTAVAPQRPAPSGQP